ncbi:MAG: hypothetical protein K8R53_06475 [Bacteroidales bacterium]|nr:hypothetical protein [Bacteroidales bacterium]
MKVLLILLLIQKQILNKNHPNQKKISKYKSKLLKYGDITHNAMKAIVLSSIRLTEIPEVDHPLNQAEIFKGENVTVF